LRADSGVGRRSRSPQRRAPRIDLDQFQRGGIRLCISIIFLFPDRKLTSRSRPSIRHCPVCGIAMLASKSREDLAHFDLFECLSCRTQIRETKPRPAPGDTNFPLGETRARQRRSERRLGS